MNGKPCGFAGQLWPADSRALDSTAPVLFAEIDLIGGLSACPGGDCSSEHSSDTATCHPLLVETFAPHAEPKGWNIPSVNRYNRSHGR